MKGRRHLRAARPILEQVEGRALLTALVPVHHGPVRAMTHRLKALTATPGFNLADGQGPVDNATDMFDPSGNPTPHELAREQFHATFTGTFTVGNGRYDSQAQSFAFHGAGEGSYFLHGDAQMGVITPRDPSRPLSGSMTMFDRNNNTNFAYGLDLAADRVTGVDRYGRPTRLTYTTDVNTSAGLAAESFSRGIVKIRYHSATKGSGGVLQSGVATMLVRGRIYTLGTNQILRNAPINP